MSTERVKKVYPKSIDTLFDDIDTLFTNNDHKVSQDSLDLFTKDLVAAAKRSIEETREGREFKLRFSNLGRKDRFLYFEANDPLVSADDDYSPKLLQRFMFGNVVEALFLFLTREAGHTVELEQLEVNIDGIVGHIDCLIDGVPVDLKSVSPYQFWKFSSNQSLKNNDAFGYIMQLAGYYTALKEAGHTDSEVCAFIAQDKSDSTKQLLFFHEMELPNVRQRIRHLREMLKRPVTPELCYPVEEPEANGNVELGKNCKFCKYKGRCFPELRGFRYSSGVKFFTTVVKTPRVQEINLNKKDTASDGSFTQGNAGESDRPGFLD